MMNFFIVLLVGVDFIVIFICMLLFYVYNVIKWLMWFFGSVGCRILLFLVYMLVMVLVLSLLVILYDCFILVFFLMK